MKKIVLLFLLLCSFLFTYAQVDDDGSQGSQGFDVQKELERQVNIPNTPEAQAFEKYGNTSVSMYTGSPNISVPLYTITGRELNVPISLTYDASGVKVSQMATQAGLSWNLNAGGRISRTVNGLVDDYYHSSRAYLSLGNRHSRISGTNIVSLYNGGINTGKTLKELVEEYKNPPGNFSSLLLGQQYINFLKDLSENQFDTQPDYFSFNALGYSDTFVYDPESEAFVALKNPRTKITATYSASGSSLEHWVVTLDNGIQLYFEEAEQTEQQSNDTSSSDIPLQRYNSSWVLTKIVSPLSKDRYTFGYINTTPTDNESYLIGSVTTTFPPTDPSTIFPIPVNHHSLITKRYHYKAKVLKNISHNEQEIVHISFKERLDQKLANNSPNYTAIDTLSIYKPVNGKALKKIKFHHSYFGISSTVDPENFRNSPWQIRLKLDSIDILSANNLVKSSYAFEYISPESVVSRLSLGQDYLGLNNGGSNSVLYPTVNYNGATLTGADRSPNFDFAKRGLLQTISYPTGGYTTFEYEPHQARVFSSASNTIDVTYGNLTVAGGSVNNDENCGNCCIDQYVYAPNIQSTTFPINEQGIYDIEYSETGNIGETYLIKISDVPLDNATSIPYDSIINQETCAVTQEILWYNLSNGSSIILEPGTYQLTTLKQTGTLSVRVHREEQEHSSGYYNATKAGIRIHKIKDYSNDSVLASEKEYQYILYEEDDDVIDLETTGQEIGIGDELPPTTGTSNGISSGRVLFNPSMYSIEYYNVYEPPSIATRPSVVRRTSWSGGDRPHVAYSTVIEIQKAQNTVENSEAITNGYQVYQFNVGMYNGVSTDQYVNYYRSDFSAGKEKKMSVYDTADVLQTQEKNEYQNFQYFGSATLYPFQNPLNGLKYILFREVTPNIWRYNYMTPTFAGYQDPSQSWGSGVSADAPLTPQQPEACIEEGAFCFPPEFSSLGTRITYAQGKTGGVIGKESSQFFNDQVVTSISTYEYDTTGSAPNYLLTQTETTNDANDVLKQAFSYPTVGALVSANILANPIETRTYKNEQLVATQKTFYPEASTYPSKIQTAKGASPLEDRLFFEHYKYGNLVQARQADGTTTTYLWGYRHGLPIAKIDNATYAQVESYVENLTLLSNQDDDHTIDLRDASGAIVSYQGNEGLLREALNNLRSSLPNAQVTTYTYNPLIGLTSTTDPRGQTVYYEYDAFNRLRFVKDQEGQIIRQNQYHYKN